MSKPTDFPSSLPPAHAAESYSDAYRAAVATPPVGRPTAHVRAALAKRGGNSFYRDRRDRVSVTLCGAPVTEYDHAIGGARKAAREGWPVCPACLGLLPARKA